MITSKKISASLFAVTLCLVSAAQAQEAGSPTNTTAAPTPPQVVSRCSQLIGARVENQQGEELGKITDVVVSFNNERVSYCVLSAKHGLFGKTRLLPVPLAALQPSADGSRLVLAASQSNLAKAKGLGPDELTPTVAPEWGADPAAQVELPAPVVFTPDVALNSRDKHFVTQFANITLELARIGQLAQSQSQDPQVKELGQRIVQDYGQAAQRVAASARAAGADQPPQLTGRAARAVNKLSNLSGPAFDQAAVRELFQCVESTVQQLDFEVGKGGNLSLRQLAELLQDATEPDVWETVQLSAQINGHP
jgi:hypothetical protein